MSTLLLMQYNNYFNRTIKVEKTIEDYVTAAGTHYQYFNNINFNPNDDINTQQIINWNNNWTPDYLLVIDGTQFTRWFVMETVRTRGKQYQLTLYRDVIADYNEEVKDSIAFIEKGFIKDSSDPLIHNKEGFLVNQIKKQETLLTDKSECPWLVAYLAKEKIIGPNPISGTVSYIPSESPDIYKLNSSITSWKFYQYINQPLTYSKDFRYEYWWSNTNSPSSGHMISIIDYNGEASPFKGGVVKTWHSNLQFAGGIRDIKSRTTNVLAQQMRELTFESYTKASQALFTFTNEEDYNELLNYNGKNILDSLGKVYRVTVSDTLSSKEESKWATNETNIYSLMNLAWNTLNNTIVPNDEAFKIITKNVHSVRVVLTELVELEANYTFAGNDKSTMDSPLFDIICVPYPNVNQEYNIIVTIDHVPTQIPVNREWSMAIMESICRVGGGDTGYVYDLQLLPYCPIQEKLIKSPKGYYTADETDGLAFVKTGNNIKAVILVAPKSTFTVDIDKQITLPTRYTEETKSALVNVSDDEFIRVETVSQDFVMDIPESLGQFESIIRWMWEDTEDNVIDNITTIGWNPTTRKLTYRVTFGKVTEGTTISVNAICRTTRLVPVSVYNNSIYDIKVSNECDFYRLTSPNYNGQFEFNLVSNGNSVSGFHADCTYKPFTPYIQVHPYFKDLYGKDFEDARGLICGGDFSLGMLKDAYQVYEIQNKNYQNIFDRQIQNMDVNNKIARQEAGWQMAAGTLQGTAAGAAGGAVVGGIPGAIAGAAVGGVTSGIGGAMDLANLAKRQNEARSFAIDNFNMSLQNIQALPLSITRTSAITANNKLFPFLEYFSCTDEEKDAFVNKLEYDGMMIGKIDTIRNYTEEGQWFKGKLIRNETIKEDSHLFETIYNELNEGVYM